VVPKFTTRTTTVPEIQQHLKCLVYEGFIRDLSLPQLKHLPRYLKAVKLRLERLDYDPHKDAQKAAQLAPLWEAYWQRRQTLESPPEEFLELRWMLEELRVSLFAQELKTAYPVSVQKLQKCLVNG